MNWHQNNALACFSYDCIWAALWWHGRCSRQPVDLSTLVHCRVARLEGHMSFNTWQQNKASFSQLWLDVGDVIMTLTCRPLVSWGVFFIGISFSNRLNNALAETESHINFSQITSGIFFFFFEFRVEIFEFRVENFEFRVKIFEFRVEKFEFRVKNFEFRVEKFEFRVEIFEFRAEMFEFQVEIYEFQVEMRRTEN